uniref:Uncharacterized protein n=1 Tax=Fagus sylvatica TaxID=28930 RepID=A0A2N9IKU4_FAGSY
MRFQTFCAIFPHFLSVFDLAPDVWISTFLVSVGKLALPYSYARFWICGKPSYGRRDMVPRTEVAGVFLVRRRAFFRSRIPARPGKILAIREFHVVHECVLLSNVPGLADQLVASQEDSARKRGNLPMSDFGDLGIVGKLALPIFQRYRPCTEASLGSQDMILRTEAGVVSSIQLFWSGQRSNLVNLGQTWSKLSKLWEMYPGPRFEGFSGLVDPIQIRNGSVKRWSTLGQPWSNLVNLGRISKNVPRTPFLRLFDVADLRRIRPAWFGLSRFACRHSEKIPGVGFRFLVFSQNSTFPTSAFSFPSSSDLALRKFVRLSESQIGWSNGLAFESKHVGGVIWLGDYPSLKSSGPTAWHLNPNTLGRCLIEVAVVRSLLPHALDSCECMNIEDAMRASIEVVVALSVGSECTRIPYFRLSYLVVLTTCSWSLAHLVRIPYSRASILSPIWEILQEVSIRLDDVDLQ